VHSRSITNHRGGGNLLAACPPRTGAGRALSGEARPCPDSSAREGNYILKRLNSSKPTWRGPLSSGERGKNRPSAATSVFSRGLGIGGQRRRGSNRDPRPCYSSARMLSRTRPAGARGLGRQRGRNTGRPLSRLRFDEMRDGRPNLLRAGGIGHAETLRALRGAERRSRKAARGSANCLDILGVRPLLGRRVRRKKTRTACCVR